MKPSILKTTVVLVLILSAYVNSRSFKRLKTTKKSSFIQTELDKNLSFKKEKETEAEILESLNYFRKFLVGLLSTIGLPLTARASMTLNTLIPLQTTKDTKSYIVEGSKVYCSLQGFKEFTQITEERVKVELHFRTCSRIREEIQYHIDYLKCVQRGIDFRTIKNTVPSASCSYDDINKLNNFMIKFDYKKNSPLEDISNLKKAINEKLELQLSNLNCNDEVDGIIDRVINKFRIAYYLLGWVNYCFEDNAEDVVLYGLTQIINTLAKFLSGGIYTIFSVVLIIIRMFMAAYRLIKDFDNKEERYLHIGELIGFTIRIPLELLHVPGLDPAFFRRRRLALKK